MMGEGNPRGRLLTPRNKTTGRKQLSYRQWAAPNNEHGFNSVILQALAQDAPSHHSGSPEEDDSHSHPLGRIEKSVPLAPLAPKGSDGCFLS
jgi:hypothetical protein